VIGYKLKIIHLASGDLWAGAEVQLFHLAKKLARQDGISLLVVLLNHGQLERELLNQGVSVKVLDESRLSGLAIFRQFRAIIKDYRPDIVHTHRIKENVLGGLAAWLSGIKSLRTVHGAMELAQGGINLRRRVFDSLDKIAALWFQQKIIAVSSELQDKLSHDLPQSKLVVIENCVDIDYVESRATEPTEVSIQSDMFNIAFVGRFVPVKRVDLFYAIAKACLQANPEANIRFHMFGDGPLFAEIARNIAQDSLGGQVYLHGFVENVAPLLKQMQLLLFTSEHEGLPMTLLEAMTLRVPVLSCWLPSIYKVLCNGDCGYFITSDSIENYVRAIVDIMSDKNDVSERVNAARRQIEILYNIDANLQKYQALYAELAKT